MFLDGRHKVPLSADEKGAWSSGSLEKDERAT